MPSTNSNNMPTARSSRMSYSTAVSGIVPSRTIRPSRPPFPSLFQQPIRNIRVPTPEELMLLQDRRRAREATSRPAHHRQNGLQILPNPMPQYILQQIPQQVLRQNPQQILQQIAQQNPQQNPQHNPQQVPRRPRSPNVGSILLVTDWKPVQYQLDVLLHAILCAKEDKLRGVDNARSCCVKNCTLMKMVLDHIDTVHRGYIGEWMSECKATHHCNASRAILGHYRACADRETCPVCSVFVQLPHQATFPMLMTYLEGFKDALPNIVDITRRGVVRVRKSLKMPRGFENLDRLALMDTFISQDMLKCF